MVTIETMIRYTMIVGIETQGQSPAVIESELVSAKGNVGKPMIISAGSLAIVTELQTVTKGITTTTTAMQRGAEMGSRLLMSVMPSVQEDGRPMSIISGTSQIPDLMPIDPMEALLAISVTMTDRKSVV